MMLKNDVPSAPPTRRSRIFLSALGALGFAGLVVLLLVLPKRPAPPPVEPRPFDTLHPHTQAAFRRLGIAPERVTQGLGFAPSSAGIHGADGTIQGRPYCAAFDLSVSDLTPPQTRTLLHTLRGAGFVCWWRVPGVSFPPATALGIENGPHIHGVDPFVPHKRRLEMQIRDYVAGNNGIEVGRYAHRPDPAAADPQTPAERRLLYRTGKIWHLRTDKKANQYEDSAFSHGAWVAPARRQQIHV